MLGQLANVALGLLARLLRSGRALGRIGARWPIAAAFHESQHELLGPNRRKPLGVRAENQRLQRHDCRAQALVLRAKRERQLRQQGRIGGEAFAGARHDSKIPRPAPRYQRRRRLYAVFVGLLTAFGATRIHSEKPSNSIANCVGVNDIAPSSMGGHVKPLSSSHLVASTIPEPSKKRSFKRSFRLARKTKTSPLYGSPPSAVATSAARPCTPLRKSTGCVETNTRRCASKEIIGFDAAPRSTLRARRRRRPEARGSSRPRSSP